MERAQDVIASMKFADFRRGYLVSEHDLRIAFALPTRAPGAFLSMKYERLQTKLCGTSQYCFEIEFRHDVLPLSRSGCGASSKTLICCGGNSGGRARSVAFLHVGLTLLVGSFFFSCHHFERA